MKRFGLFFIFALGMISISASAETHLADPSKLKRAVADSVRTDFASRANSIVGSCDTSRPGTAVAGADTTALFQAQLPSGSVGDLASGGAAGAILGGAGAGASAAQGESLFNAKCTSCHGAKPPAAVIAVLQGKPLSGKAQAQMGSLLAGMSDADKQAIIAFQKTK